jgi:hypothetical protein
MLFVALSYLGESIMAGSVDEMKTVVGNDPVNRLPKLDNIGAVHNCPLAGERHIHPLEMFQELQQLHIDAVKGQDSNSSETAMSHFMARNGNANLQYGIGNADARVTRSAGNNQHMRSAAAWEKPGMKRWHAEGAYDQAWTPLRHDAGEGCKDDNKK